MTSLLKHLKRWLYCNYNISKWLIYQSTKNNFCAYPQLIVIPLFFFLLFDLSFLLPFIQFSFISHFISWFFSNLFRLICQNLIFYVDYYFRFTCVLAMPKSSFYLTKSCIFEHIFIIMQLILLSVRFSDILKLIIFYSLLYIYLCCTYIHVCSLFN